MCVDVDYGRRGSHGGVGKGWARLGLARVRVGEIQERNESPIELGLYDANEL